LIAENWAEIVVYIIQLATGRRFVIWSPAQNFIEV